ncbi:hypothetical protein CEB3_c43840 [Peptococcaceae bacterium CEB3]|nr:hypothetical protein CEB3_c43840 [Peptococcaceae bacterium CEB3]
MILLFALILGLIAFNAKVMSRYYMTLMGFDQAARVYAEQIAVTEQSLNGRAGDTVSTNVTVRNVGNFIWPAEGANPVHMSYHLFGQHGRVVVNDGLRRDLPNDLRPGQRATISLGIKLPKKPGDYTVEVDMVQEGVTWFGQKGGKTFSLGVQVGGNS